MKNRLLAAQPNGELRSFVSAMLALASCSVAAVAWFVVWRALPNDAPLAHLALPILLLGAVPGLFQLFALVCKVCQGGRVQVEQTE